MKAVRLHEFGPAENLRYETVEDPVPGPGQVGIRVRAAGVHLIDTVLRAGQYDGGVVKAPALPTIPGREVAGVVEAVGEGVDHGWFGVSVVMHLGMAPGGYAEFAVGDVGTVHRLSAGAGFDKAVAMIGTGRTMMGIVETAKVVPEDVVLVTGASGGIGTLIVQYARSIGATVVGAAGGPDKTAAVRANGADIAVDYTRVDWVASVRESLDGRTVTLGLLGGRGGAVACSVYGLLADGGRIVTYGGGSNEDDRPTDEELAARSIWIGTPLGKYLIENKRRFEEQSLAALVDGTLDPTITAFPLSDAAKAHTALEKHQTVGKVVLTPRLISTGR